MKKYRDLKDKRKKHLKSLIFSKNCLKIIFRGHATHHKKSNINDLLNKSKESKNFKTKKDNFSMNKSKLREKYKQ